MKWNDNNDNDDKYSNNRHISIEIVNSEKTETTLDEYGFVKLNLHISFT